MSFFFFFPSQQGPFGYRGEYGEKGIPGYPGARVSKVETCAGKTLHHNDSANISMWLMLEFIPLNNRAHLDSTGLLALLDRG